MPKSMGKKLYCFHLGENISKLLFYKQWLKDDNDIPHYEKCTGIINELIKGATEDGVFSYVDGQTLGIARTYAYRAECMIGE